MTGKQVEKSLEARVLEYIRNKNLFLSGQKVLVAVSGGPDSVCLLNILSGLREVINISLQVAHLNHQLRGEESEGDALYVASLAEKLKVPFIIQKRDVRGYQQENKLSLEEAAREVRYAFLAETANVTGCISVATGHTLNDQVETIVLHIVRGTGIRGLRGLQPVQQLKLGGTELIVIRPLLEITREETVQYCHDNQLFPRNDSTNQSYSLLRNRVRHELLPLLKEYNSGIFDSVLRLGSVASDDLAFLDSITDNVWNQIVTPQGENLIIDKAKLIELHISMQRNILRRAVEQLAGTLKDIETRHIEEIIKSLNLPAGRSVSLPYRLVFYIDYHRFLLGRDIKDTSPYPALKTDYVITVPGDEVCGSWKVQARLCSGDDIETTIKKADEDNLTACLDYEKIGSQLFLHSRRKGDTFQPLGMTTTKKVGEFMLDARVPRLWRDRIPIFSSNHQIVWVAGLRIDDRVKVTPDTRTVLVLKLSRL